jgi:hypothetical protein
VIRQWTTQRLEVQRPSRSAHWRGAITEDCGVEVIPIETTEDHFSEASEQQKEFALA